MTTHRSEEHQIPGMYVRPNLKCVDCGVEGHGTVFMRSRNQNVTGWQFDWVCDRCFMTRREIKASGW